MANISLAPKRSLTLKIASWYSQRRFGKVVAPALAMGHQPAILRANARWEMAVEKWDRLDSHVKELAVAASAARLGCAWCMDFGYWIARMDGIDPRKLDELPHWRDSDVYTDLERAAIAYAEAMTDSPVTVTEDMVKTLREHLEEDQIVELTMVIAVENQRARFNSALGLAPQGFRDSCALPPAQ
ncbi:carboxymuconolactone decarboxylase family protein [Hoyosella rhizosphaerae]|uniref:Carboxymuconolactone decarboxylase-like domain-containing protein n=1 Tax=Hoyosella rhizosphaerae TaxID=1755582 RepID=A0A916X8H4_9ACTN|nr:carboxymuconolactone decarboxylase family protein [Hoyosella rhizosphaerae]MBN4927065.1 carboxymuconolactone decarboxylase family protein [Hoyosella rhizosphaerae]GGC54320.1 hypothetical protein GCM10011410_03350 [Hoyosella rhizosphaerae]